MHLCTCVSEEGGHREGVGESGDAKEGASPLELMSLYTHRRELVGAHGTKGESRNVTFLQNMSKPVPLLTLLRQVTRHLPRNLDPIVT